MAKYGILVTISIIGSFPESIYRQRINSMCVEGSNLHPKPSTPCRLKRTHLPQPPILANVQGPCSLGQGRNRKQYLILILHSRFILGTSCGTDPLVHYGRHFGRTIHALCSVSALLTNGLLRMGELEEQPADTFTHE